MGIGTITEAREVTHGEARDGGRTLTPQGTTFNPAKARVDPFAARKIQIESLKPVAEAMRRHEVATKGLEAVSATRLDLDEIQNGNPDGDGNGNFKGKWYSRKDGIWYDPPTARGLTDEGRRLAFAKAEEEIAFRKGERLRGETNDMRTFVDTETARDIEMWRGSCEEALTVAKLGETFARTEQALVNDAGTVNSSALGQIAMDEANARKLAEVSGGSFDAARATRDRTEQLARQYVRQNLEGRAKAATSFAVQSGGLMPPEKAMERANRIYDGMAKDFLDNLVAAGKFDHARIFANHAEELGYRGEVKTKALAAIDAAEMGAATAEGLKAYNTVWDENGNRIAGRDKALDAQIATLKRVAENAPKGSRTAIAALQQAGRFGEAADEVAFGDIVERIASGDGALFDTDKNGLSTLKKQPFDKKLEPRAARLWPKAVEAYNARVSAAKGKAMKAANEAEGAEIVNALANRDPQSYYRWLTERCKEGVYSPKEYKVHEADFKKKWMTQNQPQLIQEMAKIVDSTFGVEFSKWLAVDKSGSMAANPSSGQSVLAKDAALPDIHYAVVPSAEDAQVPWYAKINPDFASTLRLPYKSRISGADMKEIMDSFLNAWEYNGKDVSKEQLGNAKYNIGGVEVDLSFLYDDDADGKADKASGRRAGYHRIDAVRDFKRLCDRINLGRRSLDLWERRSDPSLLKDAERSAMRPGEIKAMGTLKAPYRSW